MIVLQADCYGSRRFPLSLVYRIFDIVFAEGIEAIFRFSLALMRRNEEKLLALDFEGILKFLGNEVFDCYKVSRWDISHNAERLLTRFLNSQ